RPAAPETPGAGPPAPGPPGAGPAATGPAATGGAPRFSDSLVVTPSLDAEPRDDTPATVTVIDAQEIADRQVRDLADLLWSVPGVTVAQAGAPGQQTSVFTRGAN